MSFNVATENFQLVVVLPFLNEQETLLQTCETLGFGTRVNSNPSGAILVAVDNGSIDGSSRIAHLVKSSSDPGSVLIGHELEQGYIPPRHQGNVIAKSIAKKLGLRLHDILIIQVDADTQYDEGFLKAMLIAVRSAAPNTLIEADIDYPSKFRSTFPQYIEMCNSVDETVKSLVASDYNDVIVDDKVSGYRLSDYFNWGGHQREYIGNGEEIHSETARLYMRARATGATRMRVHSTVAYPSMRKVVKEPALHFASAGFPRETSWMEKWRDAYKGPTTIDEFCANISDPDVQRAIEVRKRNLIAILAALPMHVALTIDPKAKPDNEKFANSLVDLLPKRKVDDLQNRPGLFITDAFEIFDNCSVDFMDSIYRIAADELNAT